MNETLKQVLDEKMEIDFRISQLYEKLKSPNLESDVGTSIRTEIKALSKYSLDLRNKIDTLAVSKNT